MSEQNQFEWAERAGKAASVQESALRLWKAAEEAEKASEQRARVQRETDFKRGANEFMESLSNQVQFAVNAFNRFVADGSKVEGPAPLAGELGFVITKRAFVPSPMDPRPRYPGNKVQTAFLVSLEDNSLGVFHTYKALPGTYSPSASLAQANRRDSFSLGLDENGQIIPSEGAAAVQLGAIARRICTPLFEHVEPYS